MPCFSAREGVVIPQDASLQSTKSAPQTRHCRMRIVLRRDCLLPTIGDPPPAVECERQGRRPCIEGRWTSRRARYFRRPCGVARDGKRVEREDGDPWSTCYGPL